MLKTRSLATLLLCGLLTACAGAAGGLGSSVDVDRAISASEEGDFEALLAEAEAHWAERSDRESTEAAIAAWEQATRVNTPPGMDRRQTLAGLHAKLSRACWWVADWHYAEDFSDAADREERQLEWYSRGLEHGQTSLALGNDAWNRAIERGEPIREAAQTLRASDVEAAYWFAVNISRWALATDVAAVLRYNLDIFGLMSKIRELNADFFNGAPYRYFGAYYTRLPFGSPNLDEARSSFETAIERFPDYLDTRFLFAADWARTTNDRAVAEEQMRAILDYDIESSPAEIRPENEATQQKAQRFFEEIDRYFR